MPFSKRAPPGSRCQSQGRLQSKGASRSPGCYRRRRAAGAGPGSPRHAVSLGHSVSGAQAESGAHQVDLGVDDVGILELLRAASGVEEAVQRGDRLHDGDVVRRDQAHFAKLLRLLTDEQMDRQIDRQTESRTERQKGACTAR
eukprot:1375664-Rhodomonas_salina.1